MSYTSLAYHLITGTKNRRPTLTPDILPRFVKYVGGTIRSMDGTMIEANGPEDHLHILALLNARQSLSDVMRDLKSGVSQWVQETFAEARDFGWQDGYSAFTVSHSQVATVADYIRRQQAHHRKMTFEEELSRLLKLHDVEFDPQYLMG